MGTTERGYGSHHWNTRRGRKDPGGVRPDRKKPRNSGSIVMAAGRVGECWACKGTIDVGDPITCHVFHGGNADGAQVWVHSQADGACLATALDASAANGHPVSQRSFSTIMRRHARRRESNGRPAALDAVERREDDETP